MKTSLGRDNHVFFHCPGCDDAHVVRIDPVNGWTWNEDSESPTIKPSILLQGGTRNIRCHSFVTNGRIQYLSDSSHHLRGRTVELPEWPND